MCETPQTWQASLPPSVYPAQMNDDVMGWKYVRSQSSLRHTGNWAWRCTVLSLPPAREMHSNAAMCWKCSLLHTVSTEHCPRANITMRTEKFTSINNRMERKKWKYACLHIFCLCFWLYLLGSKHKYMYCEKRKCSVPSGVLVSTSVRFHELCSEPKQELQAILIPATSDCD